jgi:hypothetical protein
MTDPCTYAPRHHDPEPDLPQRVLLRTTQPPREPRPGESHLRRKCHGRRRKELSVARAPGLRCRDDERRSVSEGIITSRAACRCADLGRTRCKLPARKLEWRWPSVCTVGVHVAPAT